ncbi:MAG: GspE/PulE family protein [Rhodocyclaceae bacterium]
MNGNTEPRLGEALIRRGLISADQLDIALSEQKRLGKPLGEILIEMGFIAADQLTAVLAESFGEQAISLAQLLPQQEALDLLPKPVALRYAAFPVEYDAASRRLTVAIADTHDVVAIDHISAILAGKAQPEWRLAPRVEILAAIERFYGYELSIDGILRELETGETNPGEILGMQQSYAHPVVRLVSAFLTDAVREKASDIHFEPEDRFLRIRYRIDGVLHEIRALHANVWPGMLVRLKVLSGMDIAETRAPQDGHLNVSIMGRSIDFRAATHPTVHGENFVVRILDRAQSVTSIDALGLSAEQRALVDLLLARPEGILLVTGPTGSGKTTTLYSFLARLSTPEINIMTLEDPVEYRMPLVRQTQVGEAAKIDFAAGIRSLLRQDPNVILVGEIRDQATAEMAFRAAMTGHQVLSTLHTNSALGAIPRLRDLGIHREVMAGNIIGVIAQRLVRRLCQTCRRPIPVDDRLRRLFEGAGIPVPERVYQATGCSNCRQGYRGRMAVMEIVRFTRTLDDLLAEGAPLGKIGAAARAAGFQPIMVDALRRVAEGATSLAEASRVIDLTASG